MGHLCSREVRLTDLSAFRVGEFGLHSDDEMMSLCSGPNPKAPIIAVTASERKIILAKIMIVDDDRTMTSLMQTLLELDGYDVVVVSRGSDVIAKAEQTRPAIILMDYHLSDAHGVDILRDIRAHSTLSQIPVVIASGMDVSDEVLAAGANEFLTKPFEPDDLPIIFKRFNVL